MLLVEDRRGFGVIPVFPAQRGDAAFDRRVVGVPPRRFGEGEMVEVGVPGLLKDRDVFLDVFQQARDTLTFYAFTMI